MIALVGAGEGPPVEPGFDAMADVDRRLGIRRGSVACGPGVLAEDGDKVFSGICAGVPLLLLCVDGGLDDDFDVVREESF